MIRTVRQMLGTLLVPLSTLSSQGLGGVDEWLKKPVDDKTFETFRPFFSYDGGLAFDLRRLDTTVTDGIVNEHLSFQTTLGMRVFARLFEPVDLRGKQAPGIVLLHGASGNGKDDPAPATLGLYFAKAGYRVLSLDMLYFGERTTGLLTTYTSDEMATRLYNQQATYLSFVEQTVKDVGRAYDLLTKERRADPARVALVGISRGAIVATSAGAIDRRFAAVVLIIPGHMMQPETGHLAAACDANYIGHISPRPAFIMSGTRDLIFPPEQVTALQRLAREPKEIVWVDGGHQMPQEQDRAKIVTWLQQVLH
jgi:dienelactone hydrolase